MKLLGADIDIAGQDIVHDDILDKGAPVMLLLIKVLGVTQRDIGHGAEGLGKLVVAGAEHGVLKEVGAANDGLEALLAEGDHALARGGDLQRGIAPPLTQQGGIGTGNNAPLGIDHTKGMTGDLFQLDDYVLENTVGHGAASLVSRINAYYIKAYD